MAQTVCIFPTDDDCQRLAAIIADRNRAQKIVRRARIIVASMDRQNVAAISRVGGVSRPAVWRWQRRYAEEGVGGLLRDKTRKPGKPPLGRAVEEQVIAHTCSEPPGEVTHWTGRAMAKAVGISLRSVQRIWKRHNLQPHRIRTFKKSTDPEFVPKLHAIVGLYMNPPAHALVLSIDESEPANATGSREQANTDSGPRSHTAGPALEAGQMRNHDP